jgi:tRNA nucleotidyltransferase (CCA-adding enzyme)
METTASLVAEATRIADHIRDRGGRALVVGGFVRDRLLGHESKDLDLEVYGIGQDQLPAILAGLGRVEPVGQLSPSSSSGP